MSDLTLHLQLHGMDSSARGLQLVHTAIDGMRLAAAAAPSPLDLECVCSVDRDALTIDLEFGGQRKVLFALEDGVFMSARYEDRPVLVMEATAAAAQRIVQQQQQGAGASLPRLLRDMTAIVHPNIVEVKGGFINAPPAPVLTLVCETFDQLLPAALAAPCSARDKLLASTGICAALAHLHSISRRFLLVPERVAVTRAAHPPTLTCKLLPNVPCPASLGRWSPPEHADAQWDGLASPAAVMFSFGLILMHIWGSDKLGPFPLKNQDDIRSFLPSSYSSSSSSSSARCCRVCLQQLLPGQAHPYVKDAAALPLIPKVQLLR